MRKHASKACSPRLRPPAVCSVRVRLCTGTAHSTYCAGPLPRPPVSLLHLCAATAAPLSPAALMYTNWRLCTRAAPHCRLPATDAGTCRRSCKLLNRQRSAMEPTDRVDITTASRPGGLDHDGRVASAVLDSRIIRRHRRGRHSLREGRVSPLPTRFRCTEKNVLPTIFLPEIGPV